MKTFLSILFVTALCVGVANSHMFGRPTQDADYIARLATPTGFLDFVNTTTALGWACDPSNPNTPLRVFFILDGVIFAGSTVANTPREVAVADVCGGNGNHGFVFQFPAPIRRILSNGKTHTIAAFANPIPFGKPVQLQNSPQTVGGASPSPSRTPSPSVGASPSVTPSRTPSPSVPPSPSSTASASPGSAIPIGFLDFATFSQAAGWTCEVAFPNTTLSVNIFIDGVFFETVPANLTREAGVAAACGGNPNHGFLINFPFATQLFLSNGQAHNISAFAVPFPSGSPVQLQGSPKVVQAVTTGFLDFANTTTAGGWACNSGFPNTSLTVYALVDNLFFGGAATANLPREVGVANACGGNGNHGFIIQFPPSVVTILSNGAQHNVSVFVIPFPAGLPIEIPNSPRTVQAGMFLKEEELLMDVLN